MRIDLFESPKGDDEYNKFKSNEPSHLASD